MPHILDGVLEMNSVVGPVTKRNSFSPREDLKGWVCGDERTRQLIGCRSSGGGFAMRWQPKPKDSFTSPEFAYYGEQKSETSLWWKQLTSHNDKILVPLAPSTQTCCPPLWTKTCHYGTSWQQYKVQVHCTVSLRRIGRQTSCEKFD